jgi:hypothetical protein
MDDAAFALEQQLSRIPAVAMCFTKTASACPAIRGKMPLLLA